MRGAPLLAVLLVAVPAAAQPVATPLNPLSALSVENLPAFAQRPPFAPGRRPPQAEEPEFFAAHEPLPAALPQVDLIGVVAAAGRSFALISETDTGAMRSVGPGDRLGAWTVARIAADRVVLREGKRTETLQLFVPGGRPATSDAPAEERSATAASAQAALATATGEELLEMLRRSR